MKTELIVHWENQDVNLENTPKRLFQVPLGALIKDSSATAPVQSVNSQIGHVVLDAVSVGADPVGSSNLVQSNLDNFIANNHQDLIDLATAVSAKADISYVDTSYINLANLTASALALKADLTYVDSAISSLESTLLPQINSKVTQDELNTQVNLLTNQISQKADTSYVDSAVSNKATVAYVDQQDQTLSATFNQLLLNKADTSYVNLGFDDVYRVIGLKADKTYVDIQDANLSILISSKTSRAYVDQQDNALSSRIDQKADANAVEQSLSLKADLVNGKIPESQLPSVVDDVLNGYYVNTVTFNDVNNNAYTPEEGKIYVDVNTNKTYRWTSVIYTQIGGGDLVLGETSATAYRGDRGKTAYDHSLSSGNPHGTTTSEIPEGVNLYHTDPRVRMTQLTGLNVTNTAQVIPTDYLIVALGKFQGQLNTKTELVLGETSTDAYRGDRGKVAYDHSQVTGNPHSTTTGQIAETSNLWFTEARSLGAILTGVSFTNTAAVVATDTLLQAVGKLQGQVSTKTSLTLGETSTDAYRGDRGKVGYDHSQVTGNPHGTTTGQISETSNLWFTPTRAINSSLTSISTVDTSQVTQLDTVLSGVGKLQAQVNTKTSLTLGSTGSTALAGNSTTSAITEGSNLYFTDARAKASAIAAPLTGVSTATGGVISATDTVLQAVGKLQNQITNSSGGSSSPTWVDITTVGTIASGYITPASVQVARFQGMLWIKGTFNVNTTVGVNSELFRITASAYKPYVYSTTGVARLLMLVNSFNMSTASSKIIGCSALGNITNSSQASSVDVIFEAKSIFTTTDVTINIPPTIIGALAI